MIDLVQALLLEARSLADETSKTIALLLHDQTEQFLTSNSVLPPSYFGNDALRHGLGPYPPAFPTAAAASTEVQATTTTKEPQDNKTVGVILEDFIPKRWKKPVGMPKRPLSAYNLFFKSERLRLIKDSQNEGIPEGGSATPSFLGDAESDLVTQEDEKKSTRVNPKAIGGFGGLAKKVAKRWKELPESLRAPYKKAAANDKRRYQRELRIWRSQRKEKKQEWFASVMGVPMGSKDVPSHLPSVADTAAAAAAVATTAAPKRKRRSTTAMPSKNIKSPEKIEKKIEDEQHHCAVVTPTRELVSEDMSSIMCHQFATATELKQGFYSSRTTSQNVALPSSTGPPALVVLDAKSPASGERDQGTAPVAMAASILPIRLDSDFEDTEKEEDLVLSLAEDFGLVGATRTEQQDDYSDDVDGQEGANDSPGEVLVIDDHSDQDIMNATVLTNVLLMEANGEDDAEIDLHNPSDFFNKTEEAHEGIISTFNSSDAGGEAVVGTTVEEDNDDHLESFMDFVEDHGFF